MSKAVRQTSKSTLPTSKAKAGPSQDTASGQEMMQAVLSKPSQVGKVDISASDHINGIVIGTLSEAGENGQPMVHFQGIPSDAPLPAISTQDMTDQVPGREVALSFIEGNPTRPVILGLIQKAEIKEHIKTEQHVDVRLDGEKLTLTADREITLKCGKSSITLTRAGKIIVKGAYLSNYSTGVNRIKGGSVQIN
jgi:hypothetical protein